MVITRNKFDSSRLDSAALISPQNHCQNDRPINIGGVAPLCAYYCLGEGDYSPRNQWISLV